MFEVTRPGKVVHGPYPLRPRHRGHRIVFGREVAELCDLRRRGRPQVDAGAEADAEDVLGRPVDKVEVEIVLEISNEFHFVT